MAKEKLDQVLNENIPADEFEFVAQGTKIYDKKFETKPIGYFQDAMIRFAKNKTNVTATIILGVIILCSIFIPIFSNKNAEVEESRIGFLPPRWPVIENIGIMDGYKYLDAQIVDLTTIDPETGLGLPTSIPAEYIDMDTLENYYDSCTTSTNPACVGGTNTLSVDNGKEHVTIETATFNEDSTYKFLSLTQANNSVLVIDVAQVDFTDPDAEINIYMKASAFAMDYSLVYTITEAGVHTIDVNEILSSPVIFSQLRIELVSTESRDIAYFNSIEVYDDTQEEAKYSLSGYNMANYFRMISTDETSGGTYGRSGGQALMAQFSYDAYSYKFGSYTLSALPKSQYNAIMEEYGDACTIEWVNPDDPNNYIFSEGCAIEEVIGKVGVVIVAGEEYFSYKVIANYGLMHGYETIPYFIFGTTANGMDLFKLIWIGTRTSLLLGLLVSFINITIGVVYGAISGYYGGTVDLLMQRFSEIVGRIPWLVTLSIFIALYGAGQTALIGVLVISGWIGPSAVTRTQFYRYKGREYVLASRTLGAGDGRLIFRHILPNGIGTIITSSILSIPYVIFTESTLSYLGFGIGHGTVLNLFGLELTGVSIGVLLADGRNYLLYEPYLTVWPSVIIATLMISFNMFGNALRDAFNPALRGSE